MLGRLRAGVSDRRDDSEGPFVRIGLRAARWSVVRGRWRCAGPGGVHYEPSGIGAARWLLGLHRDRRRARGS